MLTEQTYWDIPLLLDVSHPEQGYMIALADATEKHLSLQMTGPDGIPYSYFLSGNETAVIPFTGGNGSYVITAYEQINDTQYAALFSEHLDVTLENEFLPYIYPNQYVNFSPESAASKLALSMLPEDADDLEALTAIFDYVTTQIQYDFEKAQTVKSGYLPDVDETLRTKKGICFDYAALMTAMLRSRDIPCKLQIGYSGDVKHAWIDVYIRSRGWVEQAVYFDGETWTRMDPTFTSTNKGDDTVHEYIGDGSNYTLQFSR